MALATRNPRFNGNSFVARYAGFAGVGVTLYCVYRRVHLKRHADAGRDGGS